MLPTVACDPATDVPPRCRLRRLYTRPGVAVTGYGIDDRIEVPSDAHFAIGRAGGDVALRISAPIGGLHTFSVFWRPPAWTLHINDEFSCAIIDGERLHGRTFPSRPLRDGSVLEIRDVDSDEPVHRLRVEIG